jgi:PAS domain S-box-containing protein
MTRRSRSIRRSSLDQRSAVVKEEVTEQVRAHQKLESLTAQLTSELSAMTRMQQVSARLGRAGDFSTLLHDIIDAAIEITRADMGAIQLLEDGALKIVAQRGFGAPFLDFFNMTREGQAACGAAIQKGERVIVEDVANSHIFAGAPALGVMLAAGARAVQSTPLVSRSGHVLGMFSTHYRAPRRASEHELRQLDVLARQAADFIERNQAEQALPENERRFREMLDALPAAIYTTDAEGRLTYLNPAAVELSGRTPELGTDQWRVSWKLYYPDGAPMPHGECPMAVAIKEGRAVRGAGAVAERPDGKRIWFEPHPTTLRDGEGRVVGGINVLLDVTERKRAEEALRHRSEQYETLLNQAPLGVYLVDADFRIREVNPVALSFFGDVPDLIGRDFDEVIHTLWTKEYADEIVRVFRNTLGTGESYETPERVEFRVDRGVVEYHEWRIDRILLPDGRHGVVCYSRDISAQVQAREKIRESEERYRELARENQRLYEQEQRAREAAESATRAKDEFLAIVSHELRAPLNSILGWNQMMRNKKGADPYIARVAEVVERSGQTQLQLIEDLLDTARIVSGKMRLNVGPVELSQVVASAIETIRPAAEGKGVVIIPMLDPEAVQITGDPDRLQQVVWNLLSNAVKFTPAQGRIHLELRRGTSDAWIVVRDTGEGISPDLLPYVFNRFNQGDSSALKRLGGLGLGLTIVKHLVELHGGRVSAESAGAGRGATFTVTLPLATQSELGAADPPALVLDAGANGEAQPQGAILLPAGKTIAGLRVLVVDDQEDARALLADFLSRYGAEVTTASSGAEALAILSNLPGGARPDILICDITMPEEDGYTALRRMRALEVARGVAASQRIPAIALTALNGNKERLRALSAGFQMHVAKPVDPVELILVIDNIARVWRQETASN